ncbi:radical SAM/SPASM domain-containing protein [Bacillus sp. SN10]|uniref:radical SAM/SPASM domain-containing protein n=1 Tax=Bacillus sp. SN10 TaxID=2056493 RepID=UPI000C321209|nr:radical SAM protein [Bacillus sp. SN10]PKJ54484.1 radical SAM protein [Bacillus sp. SN10]
MYILINNEVILRNEYRYLDSHARFFFNAQTRHSEFISAAAFDLLVFLTKSHTIEEAWNYYFNRANELNEIPHRKEFDAFINEMILGNTIIKSSKGQTNKRPLSNLDLEYPNSSKYTPMTFPTKVNITSTMRCNLACKHCLRESSPFINTSNEMSTDDIKKLFTDIDNLGVIELAFSGGETTTRKDICEIIDHAGTLRCFFEFFTNGHRVTENVYNSLLKLKEKKKRGLQIHLSLDGDEYYHDKMRGKGSYKRVLETLSRFSKDKFYVIVESVLVPECVEAGGVQKVAKACLEKGANGISFHPASISGRAGLDPDYFQFTLSQLESFKNDVHNVTNNLNPKYPSTKIEFASYYYPGFKNNDSEVHLPPNVGPQGMYLLAIGADGSIYPCTESIGDTTQVIGNVNNEGGILTAWHSPKWDFYRGGWEIEELTACQGCKFNGNCSMQTCRCYAQRTLLNKYDAMPECYKVGDEIWETSKI